MERGRCKSDHGDLGEHLDGVALVRASEIVLTLGRVRLAKNVNTGKLAAVKIVPKSLTPTARRKDDKGKKTEEKVGDTGLSYSIEREVVIMKLIEHPNVMSLYDVWENRGELFNHPRRR
jgi:serine/threonine protein kinase